MAKMAKVTVTGGCGFIGSHLVEALVRRGNQVVVADCLQQSYGFLSNLGIGTGEMIFKRVNLSSLEAARDVVAGSEIVFHLAAMSHIPVCRLNPLQTVETNYLATANILEACRASGIKEVVYAGTDHIYSLDPKTNEDCCDENRQMDPAEIYALTKAHSVQLCRLYSKMYGLDTRVVVSGNAFGERQDESKAIPIFVDKALRGQPITVFGGQQSRDFYHVQNLVSAYLLVADKGQPGMYNVGGEEEIIVSELVRRIITATNSCSPVILGDYRTDESKDTRIHLNLDKIKAIGYQEEVNFAEGLKRTVEWYRKAMEVTTCQENRS